MKKMKKILALLLCLVLAVGAVTGTLAYLTDRDSEVNVFTVGDVKIELNEDFEQGATLIPGNKIDKNVSISNTGKNDAWVWATVLIPKELGPYTAPGNLSASNNVVHWNYPAASATKITVKFEETPVSLDPDGDGTVNEYYRTNLLWKEVLKTDATTDIMFNTVYLDTHVDIAPNGDWYWVKNGEATKLDWNTNTSGAPKIYVSAYAIQTDGFDDVEEAYAAYATQWGENGTEYGEAPTLVATAEELTAALNAGGEVALTENIELSTYLNITTDEEVTINLNGHNITRSGGTAIYVNNKDAVVNIEGEGNVTGLDGVYVNAGTVNIYDGTYTNTGNVTVYAFTADATINIYGGTFSSNSNEGADKYVLNLKDGSNGQINVYGGTYVKFDPANNTSENPQQSFVAEGYKSVNNNDGTYTVVAK